ncbi:sulfur carrier protein ThiS [Shewanella sp. UCD-KL12]|uniref:sulfur carrier protein ThiS n=1 Tax=Shewanella sp. UCD-KL12 TaxID=1917163 RepID=UPI0009FB21DC|nr:sulfur carrier protein ThiS [Shewanella sp. UCD-KL12]
MNLINNNCDGELETCSTAIAVSVNDKSVTLVRSITVQSLLEQQNIALNSVAVACNGQVVPKSQWDNRMCLQGDNFELFAVVAGG